MTTRRGSEKSVNRFEHDVGRFVPAFFRCSSYSTTKSRSSSQVPAEREATRFEQAWRASRASQATVYDVRTTDIDPGDRREVQGL